MENYEKFEVGTAEIDGKIRPLFREGKKPELFFPKHYSASEIECLRSSIDKNMYLIRRSFERVGYFYSDKYSFCKLYMPEVICEILKREFNTDIAACGQGDNFIVYDENGVEYSYARDRYNEHFGGNL